MLYNDAIGGGRCGLTSISENIIYEYYLFIYLVHSSLTWGVHSMHWHCSSMDPMSIYKYLV